ncbi:hypothetical protein A2392_03195 [Candidatus Kaiserbacteria bacterium RIFOXYB1_FULL_46_14]|uniref:Uncharacterized protein n=1 Tax=Candidatus Kaiserbacteria bacterium RIFOXYB1_FULL_46_14 TaxID=1798531 RepID=A0A1F6FJC8_9BACT|nr:MAG: hypothetical protein A2392_03195 [Candidatus Kaiserbacteria bacterium RIFOXYB1_FULL_46_14]
MRVNRIIGAALLLTAAALAGCATTTEKTTPKTATVLRGPVTTKVAGPYEAAKACVASIPEVASIRVGVGVIQDLTGKTNIQTDGTGSFITQGATDMATTSLAELGVQVVELSFTYKQNVDWYAAKGVKGSIKQPQFIVMGSVTALDFGTYGTVGELSIYGVGPRARAYRATGRMDLRLVTLPYGNTTGGSVQAVSAFQKEFLAVETGLGAASFIGSGEGLTFASFNVGSSQREPMQATIGYMTDYGSVDLVLKLLDKLGLQKTKVAECRKLLVDPYAPTGHKIQVAKAN